MELKLHLNESRFIVYPIFLLEYSKLQLYAVVHLPKKIFSFENKGGCNNLSN